MGERIIIPRKNINKENKIPRENYVLKRTRILFIPNFE
jgi:hypothetical protein